MLRNQESGIQCSHSSRETLQVVIRMYSTTGSFVGPSTAIDRKPDACSLPMSRTCQGKSSGPTALCGRLPRGVGGVLGRLRVTMLVLRTAGLNRMVLHNPAFAPATMTHIMPVFSFHMGGFLRTIYRHAITAVVLSPSSWALTYSEHGNRVMLVKLILDTRKRLF